MVNTDDLGLDIKKLGRNFPSKVEFGKKPDTR